MLFDEILSYFIVNFLNGRDFMPVWMIHAEILQMAKPVVICFSGKRKSGKDFVANLLANRLERLDYEVVVCGVSHPLKEEYAQLYDVDAERLKFDMAYKERYRADMIAWGERIRNEDPGYFCRWGLDSAVELWLWKEES